MTEFDEEQEERPKDDALDDAVRWLMAALNGRRVAWWLLEMGGVYRSSFTIDSHVTAFNEGRRDIGLRLMAKLMDVDPDAYARMVNEHRSDNV